MPSRLLYDDAVVLSTQFSIALFWFFLSHHLFHRVEHLRAIEGFNDSTLDTRRFAAFFHASIAFRGKHGNVDALIADL